MRFPERPLRWLGIDPKRYWLLMDLFSALAERREVLSHLGRDGITLKISAGLYCGLSAFMALMFFLVKPPLPVYFWSFQAVTAFLLLSVLLSETSNSLVNPMEGLVLAHQPIDGATYTAAKLSHLMAILLYLVPAFAAIPALAGLLLPGAPWYYPLAHLLTSFAAGIVVGLLCCAVFGWLLRFVPPARLKSAGQLAETLPWVVLMFLQFSKRSVRGLHLPVWLSAGTLSGRFVLLLIALAAVAIVVLGIRSLSGDYLVRVSAIAHGRSSTRTRPTHAQPSGLAARWFGGQPARAGFAYVSRMMTRDWQFRRQLIPMMPSIILPAILVGGGIRNSPFAAGFAPVHILPHVLAMPLFVICSTMRFGGDYKAAWLFLLTPNSAFRPFARGVFGLLWLTLVAAPHAVLLPVVCWYWGPVHGLLFSAYSLAVSSTWLALELRLIEAIPFSQQPEVARGNVLLPIMFAALLVIGIAVGIQHFLLFRSPAAVLAATLLTAAVAILAARASLNSFEAGIRYNLSLDSADATLLYREIDG